MQIDFKEFEKVLAENKVYDAWQYVQSLKEVLGYMEVTYQVILGVRENTKSVVHQVNEKKYDEIKNMGKTTLLSSDLEKTRVNICGREISDGLYLRKSVIEFFHYARVGMDEIFQIINLALLGDKCVDNNDRSLISNLKQKLSQTPSFKDIVILLDKNKDNEVYQYIQAFDNYTKHIRTIPITIKYPFFLSTEDCFTLNRFTFRGKIYNAVDAVEQLEKTINYSLDMIDKILVEVQKQIPNSIGTNNRIQTLKFMMRCKELENGGLSTDYVSYFIEVENGLEDLSGTKIKVHPLIILSDGTIQNIMFSHDKIFICKGSVNDENIIGCATLEDDKEECLYRTYKVEPCDSIEYRKYIHSFKDKYSKCVISNVIEGEIVIYKYSPTNQTKIKNYTITHKTQQCTQNVYNENFLEV